MFELYGWVKKISMMRYLFGLWLGWCMHHGVMAQSLAGITGIRDTSFTIQKEYEKLLKQFPAIQIPQPVDSETIAEKRDVTYCRVADRALVLDVFSPVEKSVEKRTALIIIHGGGWRSGDKSLHHGMAQHLAKMGYVCITPEYRLSTEALYPAAVHDLKAVIRWVRAHAASLNIDPENLVAIGHSAGGELAAFLGATNGMTAFEEGDCNRYYSSSVNAVVDMDGTLAFIHPESGEGDDSKRISAATYWFGYSKTDNPELWVEAAPLTHVGKSTPPTFFMNSMVERMHAGRDDFMKLLQQYGTYAQVKTYEGAPHSFCLFEPWFTPMLSDIDQFVKRVLQ